MSVNMTKLLMDQTVEDVFNMVVEKPPSVKKDAVLKDAVDAIIGNSVSQRVYIVDGRGRLAGMITMESLLKQVGYRIGARKAGVTSFLGLMKDILHEDVEHFITSPLKITKETKLVDALKLMVENRTNDLPVVDGDGVLIGELNGLEILVAARKLFKEKDELERERTAGSKKK